MESRGYFSCVDKQDKTVDNQEVKIRRKNLVKMSLKVCQNLVKNVTDFSAGKGYNGTMRFHRMSLPVGGVD